MLRELAIVGAAMVVLPLGSAAARAATTHTSGEHFKARASQHAAAHRTARQSVARAHTTKAPAIREVAAREPVKRGPDRLERLAAIRAETLRWERQVRQEAPDARKVTETPVPVSYRIPAPEVETSVGAPTSLAFHLPPPDEANPPPPPSEPLDLTDQETQVSAIAAARGDNVFLMVDKTLGKIILFKDGKPTFASAALTGESLTDKLPDGELGKDFDNLNALSTKVTPAGRFTVRRGFDAEYGGPLLDINEIKGKDWGIAIHQVWLGDPKEHRAERLASPSDRVKHITFGCINLSRPAIRYILRELPQDGPIPLYVLPVDQTKTAEFFANPTS